MAQVTIAGVMDTAYYSYDGKSRDGTLRLAGQGVGDGSWAGSRIRFSGMEDLGGGTKAEFWLEQGISPTHGEGMNFRTGGALGNAPQVTGSSTTAGIRQAYVGMTGDMGTLRVGRLYGATYDFMAVTPTTTLQGMPSANVHINGEYIGTYNQVWASLARTKGINYQSPTFGGAFKYYGTYGSVDSATESVSSAEDGAAGNNLVGLGYQSQGSKAHSHRLSYLSGPTRVALVYERVDASTGRPNTVPTATYYGAGLSAIGTTPQTQTSSNTSNILAGYNFGFADVAATYGTRTLDTSTTGQGSVTSAASNFSQLNFRVPVNKWEFRYTWNKAWAETTTIANGVKGNTFDWNGQLLGAAYHFSGRTKAYFFSGTEKEEVAAQANTNNITRHAVGLFHSF